MFQAWIPTLVCSQEVSSSKPTAKLTVQSQTVAAKAVEPFVAEQTSCPSAKAKQAAAERSCWGQADSHQTQ